MGSLVLGATVADGVILRFDGARWAPYPTTLGALPSLGGVWGAAPDDVWAVGQGILLHWDGRAWSASREPPVGYLLGVSGRPTDDGAGTIGGPRALPGMDADTRRSSGRKRRRSRPIPGARRGPFPGFVAFCDPTLRDEAPEGSTWVHEIKTDGYRAQLHLRAGKATVYSRRGYDWTGPFAAIAAAARDFVGKSRRERLEGHGAKVLAAARAHGQRIRPGLAVARDQ